MADVLHTVPVPRALLADIAAALQCSLDASFSIQDGIFAGQSETPEVEAKSRRRLIAIRAVLREADAAAQPMFDKLEDLLREQEQATGDHDEGRIEQTVCSGCAH